MLRAVVLAARLEFTIDEPILEAIAHPQARDRAQRAAAAARGVLQDPALRACRRGVPAAARHRAAEGDHAGARRRAASRSGAPIAALDRYRAQFEAAPDSLTNADPGRHAAASARPDRPRGSASPPMRWSGASSSACCRSPAATSSGCSRSSALQPRLLDIQAPHARAARAAAPSIVRRSADLARNPRRAPRRRRALARAAGADRGDASSTGATSGGRGRPFQRRRRRRRRRAPLRAPRSRPAWRQLPARATNR